MATVTFPPDTVADDALFEVVDGRIVEKPPIGAYSTWLASFLQETLGPWVRERQLGRVVTEMLFRIDPTRDLQRRPEVSFVSYDRWVKGRRVPKGSFWDVVPDLAIEVVSPTNTAGEVVTKVAEYFQAGVRQVWVIYPDSEQVYVYSSPESVRIFSRTAELDGEPLFPGFRLALTTLFEDETD